MMVQYTLMSDSKISKKIVAVVGPTATGKTALALQLAEAVIDQSSHAGVLLISVDSRQVYKGLEVCTGVDVPETWQEVIFCEQPAMQHSTKSIFLMGTSLIQPTEEWSVAHFRNFALPLIQQAFKQKFFVILVGGTGLYHEHLFSTDPAIHTPPNEALRNQAAQLSLSELQAWVERDAEHLWQEMNADDRQNPRRLVRALEKQQYGEREDSTSELPEVLDVSEVSYFTLGILDTLERIKVRITSRVTKRFLQGTIAEVERLVANYNDVTWKLPAFSSTGCRELRAYIEGLVEREQLLELWTRREVQYAKRQLTWWKAHSDATTQEGFSQKQAAWYNLSTDDDDWQTAAIKSCILAL
jgi:tRNA dimethylallyltransferase